jgi:hypothetical protein
MQPIVHTTDSPPTTDYTTEEEEDLQNRMKFVAEHLDDILVLIRCGFIRLLGEWGEPALACVLSESFKNQLREKGAGVEEGKVVVDEENHRRTLGKPRRG